MLTKLKYHHTLAFPLSLTILALLQLFYPSTLPTLPTWTGVLNPQIDSLNHFSLNHLVSNILTITILTAHFRPTTQQQLILFTLSCITTTITAYTLGPLPYLGLSGYAALLLSYCLYPRPPETQLSHLTSKLPLAFTTSLLLILALLDSTSPSFHQHISSLPPNIPTNHSVHITNFILGILLATFLPLPTTPTLQQLTH